MPYDLTKNIASKKKIIQKSISNVYMRQTLNQTPHHMMDDHEKKITQEWVITYYILDFIINIFFSKLFIAIAIILKESSQKCVCWKNMWITWLKLWS